MFQQGFTWFHVQWTLSITVTLGTKKVTVIERCSVYASWIVNYRTF